MDPNAIVSLLIEESASDQQSVQPLDEQLFHIRLANSSGQREAASVLLQKMYGWRGYEVDPHAPHLPNRITLAADNKGETVGTMSLCLDDPQIGLPADENFADILSGLRQQGRRLCEPARLAIDRNVNMRVFAALIHISYVYAHNLHGATDYVIEVNPRHVMFYRRMLGFHTLAPERHCNRVGAPAVLLRLDLDHMREQIEKFGGRMDAASERSFYPYFFSPADEAGITVRLREGRN
ncbi:N-acyl amino acid synthase FeeM domain-containing protein [Pseudoduganella guangdongensis]|uniref:N-acyl amino acid synthase FeeM domain-containing protein n=1 Tax=Pseudoduganella guangdongensis TaxID=2692179 RepID=UPI0019258E18